MSAKPTRELKHTAYHEAGHAVAAIELHRGFKYATIEPSQADKSLGHILLTKFSAATMDKIDTDASARTRSLIEREVIVYASGNAGAAVLTKRGAHRGFHGDVNNALDLLDKLSGSHEESEAYLNWLWIRANNLIMNPRHTAEVVAVAEALLRERSLSYAQIRAIVSEVGREYIRAKLREQPPIPVRHGDGSVTYLVMDRDAQLRQYEALNDPLA